MIGGHTRGVYSPLAAGTGSQPKTTCGKESCRSHVTVDTAFLGPKRSRLTASAPELKHCPTIVSSQSPLCIPGIVYFIS